MKPEDALQRLLDGNQRFVNAQTEVAGNVSPLEARHREGQQPFAIILGCSDSRVPAELVFDQGIGDLFVIRVAGNIVAPSQIGSIEFAAEKFGTRLVVVLGHSECGAVTATLEELQRPGELRSKNLAAIVDRIRPAVSDVLDSRDPDEDAKALVARGVQANIRASVAKLQTGSRVLRQLVAEHDLLIVGAEYSLITGEVSLLPD